MVFLYRTLCLLEAEFCYVAQSDLGLPILLPQPPGWLRLQACITRPSLLLVFETRLCCVVKVILKLAAFCLSLPSVGITDRLEFFRKWGWKDNSDGSSTGMWVFLTISVLGSQR